MYDSVTNETTSIIVEDSRFWFQRVLVPIMVCIGISGNTITVMVLTRRRMRSSTNIYLSALAIADIIYLIFVFVLSLSHYNNIHDRKYELYWRFYGLSHWLGDAASSTSVWLTVAFTIERYIAVCHPMKGKAFCTINRAKTVTVIVYLFCILTTASTTFEHQLTLNDTQDCSRCQANSDNVTANDAIVLSNVSESRSKPLQNLTSMCVFHNPNLNESLNNYLLNCSKHAPQDLIFLYQQKINGTNQRSLPEATLIQRSNRVDENTLEKSLIQTSDVDQSNYTEKSSGNDTRLCCFNRKVSIGVEGTNLGKNRNYKDFMHWYSALGFGIIPLVLIATFNSFLVRAVYMSQKRRMTMTRRNTAQITQSENNSVSNENRITIMLIAVVIMFLVCQTPTASYLIFYDFYTPATPRAKNIQTVLGNVFNFLLTVNASCNFLLYSTISKKFRSTFKQVFCERNKNKARQDTIQLSTLKSNTQKFNPYRHGISRNSSEYRTPRNLETASLTSAPRSKSLMIRPLGKARSTDLVV